MSVFVSIQFDQLVVTEVKFEVVAKWGEPSAGRRDLNNRLVGQPLAPGESASTPLDDDAMLEMLEAREALQLVAELRFPAPLGFPRMFCYHRSIVRTSPSLLSENTKQTGACTVESIEGDNP